MPAIRIKRRPPGTGLPVPPASLTRVLFDETDMNADQVDEWLRRLKKGKPVDIPFDPGDEEMAGRTMKKLAALGLDCELHHESILTEEDRHRRDWRLRLSFYVAIFLIGSIVRSPWLGVLLVVIGLGATACAALIRLMTRRAERRFEALREFDPGDKVH